MIDEEDKVRDIFYTNIRYILNLLKDKAYNSIITLHSLFIAYLTSSLSHFNIYIRKDALKFLNFLIQLYPKLFINNNNIIKQLNIILINIKFKKDKNRLIYLKTIENYICKILCDNNNDIKKKKKKKKI